MRIQVYVEKVVSDEQQDWAKRLRGKGHVVHFALTKPFRKPEVVDAFISDDEDIKAAYEKESIPEFSEDMLNADIEQRTHVEDAKPKANEEEEPEKEKNEKTDNKKAEANATGGEDSNKAAVANVKAGIEQGVAKNTGGTGALDNNPKAQNEKK